MKGLHPQKSVLFATLLLLLLTAGGTEAFSQDGASAAGQARPDVREVATATHAPGVEVNELKIAVDEVKKDTTPFSLSYSRRFVDSQTGGAGGQQPNTPYVPLTAGEKVKHGFRSAFLRPEGYIFSALSATITQLREEDQPQKTTGDEVADALSRFARNSATRSTKSILGSGVYPALFKQDPRYFPSGKKGFGPRALYAISRVFVTRGDNGESQPNVSRLAGTLSAAALANIWERSTPGHDRIGVRPTFIRFGRSLAFDALQFVIFREFNIAKIFKR
ncbi:MAG TPA: hypothetical protein VM934_07215 [Pyrinomonadaceae bacterium]|nr:hypothetical protein [Pyrinomonadaceae bacterium]